MVTKSSIGLINIHIFFVPEKRDKDAGPYERYDGGMLNQKQQMKNRD